jgi:hypothetical protein
MINAQKHNNCFNFYALKIVSWWRFNAKLYNAICMYTYMHHVTATWSSVGICLAAHEGDCYSLSSQKPTSGCEI